jgi:hypothetical protein
MKKTILASLILAVSVTAFAQDSMRMNSDLSGRMAARDMRGATDPAALPVIETFVPQEVVSMVTGKYPNGLYSVKQLRIASGDSAYQVVLLDSIETRLEWLGGDGAVVTNIYRVDTGVMATDDPMNMNNNMNTMDTSMNNRDANMNNMNRDTMNNMNMDTSMNNMNRDMNTMDTSMNNMNRDTMNNMNNQNIRDTATRRDSMNMSRTNPVDINYNRNNGSGRILLYAIKQTSYSERKNFVRRRINTFDF